MISEIIKMFHDYLKRPKIGDWAICNFDNNEFIKKNKNYQKIRKFLSTHVGRIIDDNPYKIMFYPKNQNDIKILNSINNNVDISNRILIIKLDEIKYWSKDKNKLENL